MCTEWHFKIKKQRKEKSIYILKNFKIKAVEKINVKSKVKSCCSLNTIGKISICRD